MASHNRRGHLDRMRPTERSLDGYLCRVSDVIPVGSWKLQLSGQYLVEEIFLEIILAESVTKKCKESQSHDTGFQQMPWESREKGLASLARAFHVTAMDLNYICDDTFSLLGNVLKNISIGLGIDRQETGLKESV